MTRRRNGEGSIYPVKDSHGHVTGYRGYVWCTKPSGERYRKYVKGKTYEAAQRSWFKLRDQAGRGPVTADVPKLADFLSYWLKQIVEPNLAPKTHQTYELFVRLHIVPYLGHKRLDKITVRDVRQWLNQLASVCQCCAQRKDAKRLEGKRRCCAIGQCCNEILSPRSRKDARDTLRAAFACAIEEEIITRNPVTVIRLPAPRKSRRPVWTVDEARRFLESARQDQDVLYAAYVLILVLGLRKGEVLGLTWARVDFDATELYVSEQLQRVKGPLIRRQVKTESSEAPLPLPELCVTALRLRHERQSADREHADGAWVETGLVFTSRHGTPVEPSNFDRSFNRRIVKADVPKISRHSTRKTCGSLLAALDVHPRVAMQILRHSKIAITMEIYTEVPSAVTREALRKLGQWLDEADE
jgi:integrase